MSNLKNKYRLKGQSLFETLIVMTIILILVYLMISNMVDLQKYSKGFIDKSSEEIDILFIDRMFKNDFQEANIIFSKTNKLIFHNRSGKIIEYDLFAEQQVVRSYRYQQEYQVDTLSCSLINFETLYNSQFINYGVIDELCVFLNSTKGSISIKRNYAKKYSNLELWEIQNKNTTYGN